MSQTKVKSGLLNFPDQTDFVKLPSGTTAQRPSSPEKGYSRYNTTDNKLEYWNGTIWQQLPGIVPPTIESVSYPGDDLAADPAGGQTITLTGTNFLDGATVEIEGTLAPVVTVVSKTEITFTAPAKAAGDYDILLTNGDNTTATFVDGITYNGLPSWTTPAGNLGTFPAGSTIPTITLVATEPDSGVVSYSVTTGALPTGLTLTGADIDGTVPTPAGQTTYNFSVTASDDENQESTERAFNIVVYIQVTNIVDEVDPFDNSSGVALYKLDGDATDESGNYNGTATNVTYSTGVFGQAINFNGSSTSKLTTSLSINTASSFSISGWIKSDLNNTWQTWALAGSSNSDALFMQKRGTGQGFENSLRFLIYDGGIVIDMNSPEPLTIGEWFHFAATINGSVGNLYINGANVVNNVSYTHSKTYSNLTFGQRPITPSEFFDGSLDQIRIFNTELTPLEVESLYREKIIVCGGQADTLDILGDNSCIATYQLNGNANDLSGNYSGTPTNVSYGVGEFDLAGVFNGSSSYIDTALNSSAVSSSSDFTISAWVNIDNFTSSYSQILVDGSNASWSGLGFSFQVTDTGLLRLNLANNGSSAGVTLTSSAVLSLSTWYNVIAVIDVGNEIRLYLNGVSVANSSISSGARNTIGNWQIGRDTSGARWFDGSIDQVRIFNKALSAGEITTLYNETACDALACGGTTNTLDILSDGSCIAAYPLDGSPLDLSGNYNGVQTDVTYPQGYFDLAGSFNGTSSAINTGIQTSSNDINSYSMWFKTTTGGLLFYKQSTGTTYGIREAVVDKVTGFLNLVAWGGSGNYVQSAIDYRDNQWHHIACIFNYPTKELYVDGQFIGSNSSPEGTTPATNPLHIGSRDTAVYVFDGEIDQVRIFNKAISAGEVTTLYNETACN